MQHVQIVSVGHSGSSLLNVILGAHPQMLSVGEVWSLQELWDSHSCACAAALNRCPLWTRVMDEVAGELNVPLSQLAERHSLRGGALRRREGRMLLTPSDLLIASGKRMLVNLSAKVLPTLRRSLDAAQTNLQFLESAARLSERPVVIDSSKNPLRAKLLYLADPDRFKMIHMVRDGRGVANSWVKAYGLHTFQQAARQWKLRDKLIHMMTRDIPRELVHVLRYEDFCEAPEETMQELCTFIGIEFDAGMFQYQDCERHDVHINPRPLRAESREITLDEKWRRVVPPEEIAAFEDIGGKWNRKYGYGD